MNIFDDVRYFSQKKIFFENNSSETCKTLKETKSRNLGSVAQSTRKQQTIFGRPVHNAPHVKQGYHNEISGKKF